MSDGEQRLRRPMTEEQFRQRQQHEAQWHTDQRCQVCGAHLLLRDLVNGRAVHERERGGFRTRCPEHREV